MTDPESKETSLKKSTIRLFCYTDGARKGKQGKGPAGAGVAIYKLKKKPDPDPALIDSVSECLGIETNQVAELRAVEICLDTLRAIAKKNKHGYEPHWKIKIITDSKYAIGMITQGWKAKANVELISRIIGKWKRWTTKTHSAGETKMKWVKGHNGDPGNEMADKLADAAANKVKYAEKESSEDDSPAEEDSSDEEKISKKRKITSEAEGQSAKKKQKAS